MVNVLSLDPILLTLVFRPVFPLTTEVMLHMYINIHY